MKMANLELIIAKSFISYSFSSYKVDITQVNVNIELHCRAL